MLRENIEIKMPDNSLRKIRIALPEDYRESDKTYPVLYMFDGQNLFDVEDSFAGTIWNVNGAMDRLVSEIEIRPMVIIGIDNAGDSRLHEYSPWPFSGDKYSSRGEGQLFADHFINSILPILERKYRISKEKNEKFIAGSSLGALISAYIVTKYPDVFSSAGIFSLASWVSEKPFMNMIMEEGSYTGSRFFIQVGTEEVRDENGKTDYNESQKYIESSLEFLKAIISKGAEINDIHLSIGAGKTHNEGAWASYMPEFILWLTETEK